MNLEYLEKLKKKNILVLGFARSGYQVAKVLNKYNISITVNSNEDLSDDILANELVKNGVKVISGSHPLSLLDNLDLIIKNPGIPYDLEFIKEAKKKNIQIITEIELAYLLYNPKIIAVTGTNGKTTTATLIYNILKEYNPNTQLAGNIGYPLIEVMENNQNNDIVVLEISSFQLNGIEKFKPHIAVITNLGEAHLDYHGNKQEYHSIKKRIYKNQKNEDYIILKESAIKEYNIDEIKSKLITYDTKYSKNIKAYVKDNYFLYNNEIIFKIDKLKLKGEHNLENCINASIVALLNNIPKDIIRKVLYSFSGVKHRLQYLGDISGVSYYNDSKSTNPTSTLTALSAFEKNVILICGGKDRGIDFQELTEKMYKLKAMICVGETKDRLKKLAYKNNVECYLADKVKDATLLANSISQKGDIVLLSPACASWDQYKNFEARGEEFIETYNLINTSK